MRAEHHVPFPPVGLAPSAWGTTGGDLLSSPECGVGIQAPLCLLPSAYLECIYYLPLLHLTHSSLHQDI